MRGGKLVDGDTVARRGGARQVRLAMSVERVHAVLVGERDQGARVVHSGGHGVVVDVREQQIDDLFVYFRVCGVVDGRIGRMDGWIGRWGAHLQGHRIYRAARTRYTERVLCCV